jgi:hypothetical protein
VADKKPSRVTRKMVNDALRARGRDESLYPGDSYFFFGGGDAVHWLSSSVMVKKISDLTLDEWLARFDELLERDKKLRSQMNSVTSEKTKGKHRPSPSRAKIRPGKH